MADLSPRSQRSPTWTTRRVAFFGVLVSLGVPAAAAAQKVDSLVMMNDNIVTGEIQALTRGKLSYKTDNMGTLSIKWDKVKRLKTNNYYEIVGSSGKKYFGRLAWPAEDYRLVVVLTASDTLEMDEVVEINRIKTGFIARTSGYIDFGFNLTRANDQREWSFGSQARYRAPKWAGSLTGNSYFRFQDDTASNTSRNNLVGLANRLFKRKWSAAATLSLEQNQELNLDLRQISGLGGGYSLIRTNHHILLLSSMVLATNERYSTSVDATTNLEIVFGMDYEAFRFDSPNLDLTANISVTPSLTDFGRVRAQLDVRASYELLSDFYVGLKGFYSYDSRPPTADAVNEDYSLKFTIGWSWS